MTSLKTIGTKARVLLLVLMIGIFRVECQTFRVGISIPLTGDGAECGVAVQNAIKLAIEDVPEGFSNIKFLFEDNKYDAKTSVTTVTKLIDVDRVQLLFVWSDLAAAATIPTTERRKIPTVTVSTDPRPTKNSRYTIRFLNSYEDYSVAMLEYLRSKGMKKVGLVYFEDSYHQNILDGFRSHLSGDESLKIVSSFQSSDFDFKTTISKINTGSFEVVGVFLMPGQISAFYRQLRSLRTEIPTFGLDTFESQSEIKDAEGAMTGAVFAHNIVEDNFRRRYVQKFGNDYQIPYAANAYVFALLVSELFGKKGSSLHSEEIIDLFGKISERESVAGRYRVVHTEGFAPYFKFPIGIKLIKERSIEIVNGDG